ncbi:hypothetical protein ABEB36_010660 [Hypothenemus hampei]|uniref:Uncharacterized protein n=1 Tax=Hypothenemus hampei TaxID=57062 RepID=A0ABD1ECN9_HYPHA
MNGMELYNQLIESVHSDLIQLIRDHPFISSAELEGLFGEMGCPFETYGLGPIEIVLRDIPEVLYCEGMGYCLDDEAIVIDGTDDEEQEVAGEGEEEMIEVVDSGCEDDTDMETDVDDIFVNDMEWNGEWDMCPDHPGGCYCYSDCEF